jgi:hypothetical protein
MRTELILPAFIALVCLLTIAMARLPMEHAPMHKGCEWCGDDPACLWAEREKCQ